MTATLPPHIIEKFIKLDTLFAQLDPSAQAIVLAHLDAEIAEVKTHASILRRERRRV